MTESAKRIGCANLKDLVESELLQFKDADYITELSNFAKHKESFRAKEGETDDLVMTLVFFAWLVKQDIFESLTNTNVQRTWDNPNDIKNISLPFPIRHDYADINNRFLDQDGTVWEPMNVPFPGIRG